MTNRANQRCVCTVSYTHLDVYKRQTGLDMITFAVELGRPGVGSTFRDLHTILQAAAPYADKFEVNNPVTSLIIDKEKGIIEPSVLDEIVMSAIVEFSCRLENADSVLRALKEASHHIDTVFSLCIICRVDEMCIRDRIIQKN